MTKIMQERSAGVIIYRTECTQAAEAGTSRRTYLILEYAAGHWEFAKGKKEEGETDIEAALREVREETGIADVSICNGFQREIEYEFMNKDGTMTHKTVVFFIGRTDTQGITLSNEHQGYQWLKYEDASFRTTFAAARNVLASADAFLDTYCTCDDHKSVHGT